MTDDPLDLNGVKLRGTEVVHFTSVMAFVAMNKNRWGDDAPDNVRTLISEADSIAQAAIDYMTKQDMANATAYRNAAMLKLNELDNLWSQRNKSESVREGNRKRGQTTAEQVLTLYGQYLAAGKNPHSIRGLIANKLKLSPQHVGRILKNK